MNYLNYKTLYINGQRLEGPEILIYCRESQQANLRQLGRFMTEWMDDGAAVVLNTSGSTGTPKIIRAKKDQMLQSAAMTAEYFDFVPGQTALLCLPLHYIAGKMMVVRALFSGLNLHCIEPGSTPLSGLTEDLVIDFAPLTPMQLAGVDHTKSVRRILLGGSPVPPAVEEKLQLFSAEVYQGYGMTETLSHVAIRRVNGPERSEVYTALPGIVFEADERSCLIIRAPFLNGKIYTNDVVDIISDHQFIWRGRADNVVNSGGIKLYPEELEKKMHTLIPERFFVAGIPDERLGEKLALFVEKAATEDVALRFLERVSSCLEKYEKPGAIFFVKDFITTSSGKINRRATMEAAGRNFKK